jgi:spore coat-associated protein N
MSSKEIEVETKAPEQQERRRRPVPMLIGIGTAVVGLAITGAGVFAGLNAVATNTTAQNVTSGPLKLTMAAAIGSAGFTTGISNVAPGDTVNRYVDLSSAGNLDAQTLSLAAADGTPSKLSTDATNGLHVTVTQCSGATWTVATGTCGAGGTTSVLANNVALSALTAAPSTLVAGAVAAGSILHLQVAVTLPNQNETTTNGTLPVGTIQGLSASITWTFNELQRTATTTNS